MKHGDSSQTGEILPDPKDAKTPQTKPDQGTHTNNNVDFPDKKPYLCLEAMNVRIQLLHRIVNGKRIRKRRIE